MKMVLGRELDRSTPLLVLCKHINFLAKEPAGISEGQSMTGS